jgi:hypothetical protein
MRNGNVAFGKPTPPLRSPSKSANIQ